MDKKSKEEKEFAYEKKQLEAVISFLADRVSRSLHDTEIYDQSQELGARSRFYEKHLEEQKVLTTDAPYFGRLDFCPDEPWGEINTDIDKPMTFYVTKHRAQFGMNAPINLISWKAPLASFWYERSRNRVFSEYSDVEGDVLLRRILNIRKYDLISIYDLFNAYPDISEYSEEEDSERISRIDPDEYLKQTLEQKKGSKLQEIVVTIQEKQNKLMRLPDDRSVIIQGAAGTGKTIIALHRVGILTYRAKEIRNQSDYRMIIIGPNQIFLNSISRVLPSLDLNNIPQRTFEDLALQSMGYQNSITITDNTMGEIDRANTQAEIDHLIERGRLKGSLDFGSYLEQLASKYRIADTRAGRQARSDGITIYITGKGSLEIFYNIPSVKFKKMLAESDHLPVNQQREYVVQQCVRVMYEQHEEQYEVILKGMSNGIQDSRYSSELKDKWDSLISDYGYIRDGKLSITPELKQRALRHVKNDIQKFVDNMFERYSPLEIYAELLSPDSTTSNRMFRIGELEHDIQRLEKQKNKPEKLNKLYEDLDALSKQLSSASPNRTLEIRQEIKDIESEIDHTKQDLQRVNFDTLDADIQKLKQELSENRRKVELIVSAYVERGELRTEDISALYYLHQLLNGVKKAQFDHIIIDEAQDISPLAMYLLHRQSKAGSMTVLGDISQGIHTYRGINHWSEFQEILSDTTNQIDFELHHLDISYRSTYEITQFANHILYTLNIENTPEPFERHGYDVDIYSFKQQEVSQEIELIRKKVEDLLENNYQSIAIVCREENKCFKLSTSLNDIPHSVITDEETSISQIVNIISVNKVKGLEFEAVILSDVNEANYSGSNYREGKLLYVGVSRALHYLAVTYLGSPSPFIKGMIK